MGTCIEQELENSVVDSAKRVENKREGDGSGWLNGDVFRVVRNFALVCIVHGDVDIFKDGVGEIFLLDGRDDGDITEDQFVELLDEVWVEEDEIPALASNGSGLFFLW